MIFGELPLDDIEGAILAHSVKLAGRSLKKGRTLDAEDLEALRAAGRTSVVAARLEADDVHEDAAAARVAAALTGAGVRANAAFTGRVNLYAREAGLLRVDGAAVAALNARDEAITLATLTPNTWVQARQMVATVKIIPFAAPGAALRDCERLAAAARLRVDAPCVQRVGLVQTRLPATREAMLDKTTRVLGERISGVGAALSREDRCEHRASAVSAMVRAQLQAGCEVVLVAGASAIVDRRDVIPAGIEAAGGRVLHFGMPVDPGNLVLLGEVDGHAVVGLPGCARSPAFNGFDWVLQRLAVGERLDAAALTAMGAGGLLKESPGRPSPREKGAERLGPPRAPRVAALMLAAGQSRRMGEVNKLLAELDGVPMLRRSVQTVLAAALTPVVVVTGHQHAQVQAALAGLEVHCVHNPQYAGGLSTSLAAGLAALPAEVDAVLVCLGDMPRLGVAVIERLVAAYDPLEGRSICVPCWHGKRGNPVLWDARYFAAMAGVRGDVGARHLLGENAGQVCEVEVEDHAVLEDVDSPADLDALRALLVEGGR